MISGCDGTLLQYNLLRVFMYGLFFILTMYFISIKLSYYPLTFFLDVACDCD
jgi:hypothetical protein